MGSIITLGVDNLEIDWGKNDFFRNHSKLFLPEDIKLVTYHYADNIQRKMPGYSRPLRKVKERLNLLGYTVEGCKDLFENQRSSIPNHYPDEHQVPFEIFSKIISSVDVQKVSLPDEPDYYNFGEYVTKNILQDPEFTKQFPDFDQFGTSDGEFYENIDPYITLRLLAENPENLSKNVIWRFADVVEGGWISKEDLYEGLDDSDRYLIVTEGSSDTKILKKSLYLLLKDLSDFFDFIDMSENYPFTGAGNLYRFCQGLSRIRIQNRILVLFDNDTAGIEAYRKTIKLDLPQNMKVVLLPDIDEYNSFKTLGPSGVNKENVNGRAISIELFLDLNYSFKTEPIIRWTSFNEKQNQYQGKLINKDHYTKKFLNKRLFKNDYNTSKLQFLWKHILHESTKKPLT